MKCRFIVQWVWGGARESAFVPNNLPGAAAAAAAAAVGLVALSSKLEIKTEVQPQTYRIIV